MPSPAARCPCCCRQRPGTRPVRWKAGSPARLTEDFPELGVSVPVPAGPRQTIAHVLVAGQRVLPILARHLRDEQTVDLAWWRLHKAAPRTAIAVSAALMTGPLLGIAAGF